MLNSLKLASENNSIFHFDATYKILKYYYPLIVFGFTDATRRFFSYVYVHQPRKKDFTHFFEELD